MRSKLLKLKQKLNVKFEDSDTIIDKWKNASDASFTILKQNAESAEERAIMRFEKVEQRNVQIGKQYTEMQKMLACQLEECRDAH